MKDLGLTPSILDMLRFDRNIRFQGGREGRSIRECDVNFGPIRAVLIDGNEAYNLAAEFVAANHRFVRHIQQTTTRDLGLFSLFEFAELP